MRKRIKPLAVLIFFSCFIAFILISKQLTDSQERQVQAQNSDPKTTSSSSSKEGTQDLELDEEFISRPIIDISGWQLPSEINYDVLSQNISGVIVRVHSGAQAKKENAATHLNGLDKAYETHIKEFQKRNIPVAVYAYVAANSKKEMEKEAESFYKAASKYNPTYYWLDVEEKTMSDMNAGVEAFRAKLASLGVSNIGIYIGTYFMEEHSISTDKFTAIWIPTYGNDNGYYNAAPSTDQDYDLHQYTSQGQLTGFSHYLDLNQLSTLKDSLATYQKLFSVPKAEE
ncbi:glycoside hydrolase family 25 protein [Streptococcus panodentis]|uniref:Glycosyl hydrolase family 25 n=1 Tax=Streptococcus panodentis TaxID=1581472 RepID=A0ABS5AVY3_9STRE|nr:MULTISPECIES: glycoside hydrolase family 25 protein [Streptococcus]KXT84343.1 N-acetylmuramoyl-L-alanine amidase [Streptococcus sp. DD11]MBP2620426.1 glycosyl hydrolase family 25 [Streptococcus panodentis]